MVSHQPGLEVMKQRQVAEVENLLRYISYTQV
jgi:hypothetical protein